MLGLTGKPALPHPLQGLAWWDVKAGPPSTLAELVGPERQLPAGGDRGVLLAQRPGGGVAGVDERPRAGLGLAPVELVEARDRHVDLAPHLDHLGRAARRSSRGDGADGGHVGGHVLADLAVAPGRGPHQPPALVEQAHGQAVDLELAGVAPPHPEM